MEEWPTYIPFGDAAVLIQWEERIDENIHEQVLLLNKFIVDNYVDDIIETVIAYQSISVYLKSEIDVSLFIGSLKDSYVNRQYEFVQTKPDIKSIISIPVCYEKDYAMDIAEVAARNKLSINEIIALHTKPLYKIYFTGFLPGFPYLGGLDKKLHTPRLGTARGLVPKGSIGIGGAQTGVYSLGSPGGWNIIGKTPISCFSVNELPPTLFEAGHFIKFRSISSVEYKAINKSIQQNQYEIEREAYHD